MSGATSVQCKAISKNSGQQCKRKAIPGGTVCRYHGGGAQQVKAKAAVRAELLGWGLVDAIRSGRGPSTSRHSERGSSRALRLAARRGVRSSDSRDQRLDLKQDVEKRAASAPRK